MRTALLVPLAAIADQSRHLDRTSHDAAITQEFDDDVAISCKR